MRYIVFAVSLIILLGNANPNHTANAQQALTQAISLNANTQLDIAELAFKESRFDAARTAYQNALEIWEKSNRRDRQGAMRLKLAQVDEVQGQYDSALANYQAAYEIFTQLDRPEERSGSLSGIGIIHVRTGRYSKAIEVFQASLKLIPNSGVAINGLGLAHAYLGDYPTALEFYEQALKVRKTNKLWSAVAATLINIGVVHYQMGKPTKALGYYNQALVIVKGSNYHPGWVQALNQIGQVYLQLKQIDKATESFNNALTIASEFTYPRGEGQALEYLGDIYVSRQDYDTAIAYYHRSLTVRQTIKDLDGEASAFHHLGDAWKQKNDLDLAIVFYKKSVSIYEGIRSSLRLLPREQQSSYTKTVEKTYRDLADILLKRDRILEAQQVLDLLKVQELNNYLKNVRGESQPIENLLPEAEILQKYNAIQTSAIAMGKELTTLRKTPEAARTSVQNQRISDLTQLQEDLNQQFNQFTIHPDVKKLIDALSPKARIHTIDTADLNALRANLKQLNAVMIYPLILDDRLELIITTPDAPPLRRTVNVKREDLNKAIVEFRTALQSQDENITLQAQKLYNWLVLPLEADLKASNPKNIIYAPDGQLRYIPLSALHDGKQWFAERYAINIITAKSLTNFTQQPTQKPKILAGAIGGKQSESTSIKVGTRSFEFGGLPFTNTEVDRIHNLQPNTQTLRENQFTLSKIKPKFADYNILHLATHAAIVPGNPEDSFILFGGNTTATLKEIENWTLSNFDLVVLSACETGLAGNYGTNGEEILGLGYQFQNRGAKATIASLWRVDDGGTQELMTAFYTALQQDKSKTQALQSAQRTLITTPSLQRFSHPYYWAPFILIGNGL